MPNIEMKFDIKTSSIIDDPSKIARAGLQGGMVAWAQNLKPQYPPKASSVTYQRTQALGAKAVNSKFLDQKTVALKSTDYARYVLLRDVFDKGFAPWSNVANNMITIVVDAFKNAVKEVTSGQ